MIVLVSPQAFDMIPKTLQWNKLWIRSGVSSAIYSLPDFYEKNIDYASMIDHKDQWLIDLQFWQWLSNTS